MPAFSESLTKTTNSVSWRDVNPGFQEYYSGVLNTRERYLAHINQETS